MGEVFIEIERENILTLDDSLHMCERGNFVCVRIAGFERETLNLNKLIDVKLSEVMSLTDD